MVAGVNLFLAPDDLVPFYGGTYFPIEPRYGRPGFLRVLQSILEIYHDRNQDIQDYKEQIVRICTKLINTRPYQLLTMKYWQMELLNVQKSSLIAIMELVFR